MIVVVRQNDAHDRDETRSDQHKLALADDRRQVERATMRVENRRLVVAASTTSFAPSRRRSPARRHCCCYRPARWHVDAATSPTLVRVVATHSIDDDDEDGDMRVVDASDDEQRRWHDFERNEQRVSSKLRLSAICLKARDDPTKRSRRQDRHSATIKICVKVKIH